ncbi:MAG: YggS family pyridoxal phosphate-dependent enzyme [Puniceicoccaceae bacterium]
MFGREAFFQRVAELRERVEKACAESGRPLDEVKILPVTKNHPLEAVQAAVEAGFDAVGENKVQEGLGKREAFNRLEGINFQLVWEMIGHLQTNKAKFAVPGFDRIQSVDSLRLLEKLNSLAGAEGKRLRVLIQFNAGYDPGKFGFLPEEAGELGGLLGTFGNLSVEGLMTIAPLKGGTEAARECFAQLRSVRERLERELGLGLPELSMGMTSDLEEAIAEGSTQIRVGSFLFGSRI